MPERHTPAGFGQHAREARLIDGGDQLCHTTTHDDRQIRHDKVHAEQGSGPQHRAHRPGNKAKAVGYGRRQGARRGAVRQLGRPAPVIVTLELRVSAATSSVM